MHRTDRDATTGIRRYGPGKFDTMLDAYVYELSLNGCDDETGDSDIQEWYGLLRGLTVSMPFGADDSGALTDDELAYLRTHAAGGAIVSEDTQGFVHVEYYDNAQALDRAWQECCAATETDDDDDEREG